MVGHVRKAADYRERVLRPRAPAGTDAGFAVAKASPGDAAGDDDDTLDAAPVDDAPVESRAAVVPGGQHGQRLDKVLVWLAPEFSRSHLQHLIEGGHVRVAGEPVRLPARRVRAGDPIAVDLVPTEESRAYVPQPMALVVVHEDEDLLVLHKPAGLVVHPAAGHWSGTLLNGVLAHHAAAAALPRAGIVHRLDKDTSGLMLLGKTLAAVTALVRDIALRQVHRRYLALAWGEVAAASRIEAPIGRDPRSRLRMAVVPVSAGGREARTDVERVAHTRLEHEGEGDVRRGARPVDHFSALRCTLHTGRTHQIRVHLASRGWPLVADTLYGGRPALGLARQALHAVHLELQHPLTRRALAFTAPPPPDFARAWAQVAGATIAPD